MLLGQNYPTKNGLEGKKGKPLKPNWSHQALTSVAWSSHRSVASPPGWDAMQVYLRSCQVASTICGSNKFVLPSGERECENKESFPTTPGHSHMTYMQLGLELGFLTSE